MGARHHKAKTLIFSILQVSLSKIESYSLFPFRLLQARHTNRALDNTVLPPRLQGFIWSMVSSSSLKCWWHSWHGYNPSSQTTSASKACLSSWEKRRLESTRRFFTIPIMIASMSASLDGESLYPSLLMNALHSLLISSLLASQILLSLTYFTDSLNR